MIQRRLQDLSYLCSFGAIDTTFLESDAWLYFYHDQGFNSGRIMVQGKGLAYWEIPTRLGGKVWVFPHIPRNVLDSVSNNKAYYKKSVTCKDIESFLMSFNNQVIPEARKHNISAIKIVPFLCWSKTLDKCFKKHGFIRGPKTYEQASWHAYVPFLKGATSEDILQSFRKGTRYEIRKGLKKLSIKNISINNVSKNDLNIIYAKYKKFMQLYTKNKPISKRIFEALIQSIKKDPNTDALFILSLFNKKIVGVSMFIIYKNNMFYFLSATDKSFKMASPLYVNVFKAIVWGIKQNLNGLSLWGINLPNKKVQQWEGFSLFKSGFRPEIKELMGPYIHILTFRGLGFLAREILGNIMVKLK